MLKSSFPSSCGPLLEHYPRYDDPKIATSLTPIEKTNVRSRDLDCRVAKNKQKYKQMKNCTEKLRDNQVGDLYEGKKILSISRANPKSQLWFTIRLKRWNKILTNSIPRVTVPCSFVGIQSNTSVFNSRCSWGNWISGFFSALTDYTRKTKHKINIRKIRATQ